jgi:hypothetical protein
MFPRCCLVTQRACVQDSMMDVLASSAARQKEIARAIAGELNEQDVILEDLEDEVDDAEQVRGCYRLE